MRNLKEFEEFIKQGIVRKHFPDKSRAQDLINGSDKTFQSVVMIIKKLGINEINANTIIKELYDVILSLIRAEMLLNGFSSSGQGAHEAEVAYLKKLKFNEGEIEFINQLRFFRNGIMYYGKRFDKEYAQKVYDFFIKIKSRLLK